MKLWYKSLLNVSVGLQYRPGFPGTLRSTLPSCPLVCVWKQAERSEGMLSHIEAKGLAQTC